MKKPPMPRVKEPRTDTVHYDADLFSGNVTLCGITDWIAYREYGQSTSEPVNCEGCISIFRFCNSHSS
jgi:hypothetical protein